MLNLYLYILLLLLFFTDGGLLAIDLVLLNLSVNSVPIKYSSELSYYESEF